MHITWVKMKIPPLHLKLGIVVLLAMLSIPLARSAATEGWITGINTEETPLNETAVKVTIEIRIKVQFDSPGYYVVLVRDDSTGEYLAESIRYSVGAISEEKTVTLNFERPIDPGSYSYTAILKMKDSSSGWFDADMEHFSIVVPVPQTITNVTTVTLTETVTKALEYLQTVTQTVTATETTTFTQINITTLTILRTVTQNVTETATLTRNVTLTRVLSVTVTPESQERSPMDLRLIGLGVIGVLVAILLVMALRRR